MYAVEFETDVVSEYVRIPNFEQFKNQHVKVIVLSEQANLSQSVAGIEGAEVIDFSVFKVKAFNHCDAVAYQRAMRDEWE
ncbi:hypothetical protein THIAE_04410 [Thiomicrospira aerophila AL3]|uniref:Uncharacterized protein n=1 Tax=Thiomicrospira aerophila AL3 TaxID=717772 RepID=W0DR81_9GAMM|nr:hypothetical protein [Thiomicrospira aerophila]AHF01130.1 hypothetical protein THIAE_04410 [Thiomicrospira aerophila AL3]